MESEFRYVQSAAFEDVGVYSKFIFLGFLDVADMGFSESFSMFLAFSGRFFISCQISRQSAKIPHFLPPTTLNCNPAIVPFILDPD